MTESHTPAGPIRSNAVYVSWATRKGLEYIAKARKLPLDQIVDEILGEWLQKYPKIMEHLKARADAEKLFIQSLSRDFGNEERF